MNSIEAKQVCRNRTVVIVLVGVALLLSILAPVQANDANIIALKPSEELHLSQKVENILADVRIADNFLCADLSIQHVMIISQAPLWTVQVLSRKKGIYYEVPLQEWLRRGCPLNFFRATEIPQWPLLKKGSIQFLHQQALELALPYIDKQRHVVPLKNGNAGHLIVMNDILPANAAKIMSTLYQTPKSDFYPLQLRVGWQLHKTYTAKPNEVFLFSGGKEGPAIMLDTTQISKGPKRPLPTPAGLKPCKDPGSLWTDSSDVDGIRQLMK